MKSSKIISKCYGALFGAVLILASMTGAHAQLWYNGDDNGVNSYFSTDSPGYSGIVYDDFNVTSSGGWEVNGVYGNFLDLSDVTTANWEIRSAVSSGNGGTLVASGTSAAAVTSSTDSFGGTLYNVSITGLNFDLAAGTYWLGIQPVASAFGYVVTTSGANAVGTPGGNNGNSFFSDNYGDNFQSTTNDFSLGVNGTAQSVPEPSAWAMLFISLGLVTYLRAYLKPVKA
jgi:hypothetical protein